MSGELKLQQPISKDGVESTNFFNGRLVTGADMKREQFARREADRRIGNAVGDGIAQGLEVEVVSSTSVNPIVKINAGLAVNKCGQTLRLSQNTNLDLLNRFGTIEQSSTIFTNCTPPTGGTYTAGFGLYLLVLSPAEMTVGRAPTSGLNNAFATCNTDLIVETVQFRLLGIDPYLTAETLPSQDKLRNYIAYRCFGTNKMQDFFENPWGFSTNKFGLLDEIPKTALADSDVPLAVINWTNDGLHFVDNWSVRRRNSAGNGSNTWTQIVSDRRLINSEAMLNQFDEQLNRLIIEKTAAALQAVKAEDYFRYLPAAGIIPIANSTAKGFDKNNFFGIKGSTNIIQTDGDRLRMFLNQSLLHEPIDLNSPEKVQLYSVRENLDAVVAGDNIAKALVFARHSLPYFGTAILSTTQIITFAPNFLPVKQEIDFDKVRLGGFSNWDVAFNQAVCPFDHTGKVLGAFTIQLPENSSILKMTVRGKRYGKDENPAAFTVSLFCQEIGKQNEAAKQLIVIDLKDETDNNFKKNGEVSIPDLATVDNAKYNYFIEAEWVDAGMSDRFEINFINILIEK